MLTTSDGFQFQSSLIIRDSVADDFGYYGCAVTNSRGSDEASIYLEKQGEKKILNSLRSFKRLKLILFIMTSTACQELFCTRLSEACCARQTIVITTTNPCNPWKYFRRILSAPAADWNFCDNYCHSCDNSGAPPVPEQNKSALRAQRG